MTDRREPVPRPELSITLLEEHAPISTYVCYPSDATNQGLESMWIRFEEGDSVSLWENR